MAEDQQVMSKHCFHTILHGHRLQYQDSTVMWTLLGHEACEGIEALAIIDQLLKANLSVHTALHSHRLPYIGL